VLFCVLLGGSLYRRGDDVRDLWLGKYLEEQSRGGRVTEQPASRDDWETIVRYNEKILQQENLSTIITDRLRQPTKVVPRRNDTTAHLRRVSWHAERSNYKPPKPPKPTSPQQQSSPRRLLPVQQFLNRQVSVLLLNNK